MRRVYTLLALLFATGVFVSAMPSTLLAQGQGGGNRVAGQWTTFTKMPVAKINHAATRIGGAVFVLGGTTGTDASLDSYIYDLGTDTWTRGIPSPLNRNYGIAESINDKVYFIGGYSTLSPIFRLVNPVSEFDPASNQWKELSPMPTPVAAAGSFVVDNKIYVVGGSASGGFNTDYKDLVQIYDPATNKWEAGTPLPFAARNVGATAIGNTCYIIGGYNNKVQPAVKKEVYKGEVSGTTITWTKVADFPAGTPAGIERASVGAAEGKIWLAGGRTNSGVSAKAFTYDPATDTWEAQSDKPSGTHSTTRFVYDGSGLLYVFGGTMGSGQSDATEAIQTKASPNFAVAGVNINTQVKPGDAKRFLVTISNTGTGSCTWSAAVSGEGASAVRVVQSQGTLRTDEYGQVTIIIDANGIAAGPHTASVDFTSSDPLHATYKLPLSFTVTNPYRVGKRVFLEEWTGTWCGWCPYGVDSIHAIMERYPDNLVVASYHNGDAMEFISDADQTWLGVKFFPGGFVDRNYYAGEQYTMVGRDMWGKYVEAQAAKTTPVDITFSNKTYDRATKQTTITVNVKFLEDVQPPLRLNLLLMESGQNYLHKLFGNPNQTIINPFFHEHVVKQLLPDALGTEVLGTNPGAAGTMFSQQYSFVSKDSIPENAELVAFVHRSTANGIGEVLQVNDHYVVDDILTAVDAPLSTSFAVLENYPNPFNPATTIVYSIPAASRVTLVVTDMMGREVARLADDDKAAGTYTATWNSGALASGTYVARLVAGNTVITRSMTLIK